MSTSWTTLDRPDGSRKLLETATPGRIFVRALGAAESAFYWDGEFVGTADVSECTTVRLETSALDCDDDEARFRDIWLTLKRRYPLLGAQVQQLNDGERLQYLVDETRLAEVSDNEFEFISNADAEASAAVIERALNGRPRRLSASTLVAVTVLRRMDAAEGIYDIVTVGSHGVIDGMASCTLARTFCELLSRWPASLEEPIPDLKLRLEMAPALEALSPHLHLNLPRQRWRNAIIRVILARRAVLLRDGQSLPRTWSSESPRTPAQSRVLRIQFPREVTPKALGACRANGVTLGNTLFVLAQVALSRLLHRRVKRKTLPLDEWQSRKETPMHTGGPVNIRPLVAPDWQAAGGSSEINLCIGFFVMSLPSLPRASLTDPADPTSFETDSSDAPPLSALLPARRFWLRASLAQRAAHASYRHPLFLDMLPVINPMRIARGRAAAEALRDMQAGKEVPPLQATGGFVFTHIASSMGNMDYLLPLTFPQGHEEPTLHRISSNVYLRCRPGELYLGSKTSQGVFEVYVFYDGNVYEEAVVQEWLEEMRGAIQFYLAN